jgi:hypothetical protein
MPSTLNILYNHKSVHLPQLLLPIRPRRLSMSILLSIANVILGTISFHKALGTVGLALQRILDFIPVTNRVGSHDWLDFAEDEVNTGADDEAGEEVETVDVGCADWDRSADCTGEADDVDHNTTEVGDPSAPLDTVHAVVRAAGICIIEILELKVTLSDEVADSC